MTDTQERYKRTFEHNWGNWERFCDLVKQEVKPRVIQGKFPRVNGEPMTRQTFHRWSRRV